MKQTVVLLLFIALSLALCGCQSGKAFDSAEAMISSMEGTYSASDDHSGEYIIINKENIIKFNINDIFPNYIEESLFNENFFDEDWGAFNINVLLEKPYIKVSTEAVSADVKNSMLSDLWIDKDGTLYSSKEKGSYPFKKLSSESNFPTDEIKEKFKAFSHYLQECEISYIIEGAEENLSKKKTALDSQLASATKTSSKKECTASAEVVGRCAFESIKSAFKYPASAELVSFLTEPQKDSYGRVATRITCKYQNGFGNFITQDAYVVLQSCTEDGEYTYLSEMNYFFDKGSTSDIAFNLLFSTNYFDKDPDYDSKKDPVYLEAIEFANNGDYESAIDKLGTIEGYRSADNVIAACKNYIHAQDYKNAVDLFENKKYSEAAEKMASLITVDEDGNEDVYSKAKRIIYLCDYLSDADTKNNEAPVGIDTNNDARQDDSSTEASNIIELSESDFEYIIKDDSVTITQFIGTGSGSEIGIPRTIEGKPVTAIGDGAFSYCKNLTSMIIPDSVITIGENAFTACEELKNITLPDSVTSIGKYAFSFCEKLTSITIPNSVTEINTGVFSVCKSLTNVTIPDNVIYIDITAFAGCKQIKAAYKGSTYDYEQIFDFCKTINSSGESNVNNTDENYFGNGYADESYLGNGYADESYFGNENNNFDNNISVNISADHAHSYAAATCTKPKTCTVCGETDGNAIGHTWEAVYSTVHHDQEGHYELVKTEDGYTWYRCPMCGDEFKSLDSYYSHFDSSHSESFFRDEYIHGSVYDQYDEIWVIDKEAYDETVIIEYRCSKCGATTQ